MYHCTACNILRLVVEPSEGFSSLEDSSTFLSGSSVESVIGSLGGGRGLVASHCYQYYL
jgi:hypothetical protein